MVEHIERLEQERDEGGNTASPPSLPKKSQPPQCIYWSFTLNNWEVEQVERLERLFQHECKWYVFQEELSASGTPHLQGTLCLLKRQRRTELSALDKNIHWEPTKSVSGSLVYCTKKESAVGPVHYHGIDVPKPLKLHEPRGWQLEVMRIIADEPDERTIHWFWEANGGVGKTCLCKYLAVKHNALMVTGKSADMFHSIATNPKKRELVIVDVPRSTQDYVNYGAIEAIKNGLLFSGKYEGAQLVFNSPHVFMFANEPPREDKMSQDRWHIVNIQT